MLGQIPREPLGLCRAGRAPGSRAVVPAGHWGWQGCVCPLAGCQAPWVPWVLSATPVLCSPSSILLLLPALADPLWLHPRCCCLSLSHTSHPFPFPQNSPRFQWLWIKATPEEPARSLLAFPQAWLGQEFLPSVALLDFPPIYERKTQLQRDVSFFSEHINMNALINHQ